MLDPSLIFRIHSQYVALVDKTDKRVGWQWAAIESDDLGWGGVYTVSAATSLARNTIMAAIREVVANQ